MLAKGQIYLTGEGEVFLNTVKRITPVGCPIMCFWLPATAIPTKSQQKSRGYYVRSLYEIFIRIMRFLYLYMYASTSHADFHIDFAQHIRYINIIEKTFQLYYWSKEF